MPRYILVSFLFLGWAFYEMSGGAGFEPPERAAAPAPQIAKVTPLERARQDRAARAVATEPRPKPLRRLPEIAVASSPERVQKVAAAAPQEPQPAAAAVPAPGPTVVQPPRPQADLRRIVASRVNMRTGPGTDHNILATLDRGQSVEVLDSNGLGWLRLRTQPGDRVGWIAERLVSPQGEG